MTQMRSRPLIAGIALLTGVGVPSARAVAPPDPTRFVRTFTYHADGPAVIEVRGGTATAQVTTRAIVAPFLCIVPQSGRESVSGTQVLFQTPDCSSASSSVVDSLSVYHNQALTLSVMNSAPRSRRPVMVKGRGRFGQAQPDLATVLVTLKALPASDGGTPYWVFGPSELSAGIAVQAGAVEPATTGGTFRLEMTRTRPDPGDRSSAGLPPVILTITAS
jgi:hypothetical protein